MYIDCFRKIAHLARSANILKCSTTLAILGWDLNTCTESHNAAALAICLQGNLNQ